MSHQGWCTYFKKANIVITINILSDNALVVKAGNSRIGLIQLKAFVRFILLKDSKHWVGYGSFSDPSHFHEDEIHSPDGLLGLRVIRQTELIVGGKKRLISAIFPYEFDTAGRAFRSRNGGDSLRVRVEVEPYQPRSEQSSTRGMMGFSWTTETDKDGRLKAIHNTPLVSDALLRASNQSRPHGAMRFAGVTPCGFANHCNTCHHATKRNFISETVRQQPLSEFEGPRHLFRYLKDAKVPESAIRDVEIALQKPNATFPVAPFISALEERWGKIDKTRLKEKR